MFLWPWLCASLFLCSCAWRIKFVFARFLVFGHCMSVFAGGWLRRQRAINKPKRPPPSIPLLPTNASPSLSSPPSLRPPRRPAQRQTCPRRREALPKWPVRPPASVRTADVSTVRLSLPLRHLHRHRRRRRRAHRRPRLRIHTYPSPAAYTFRNHGRAPGVL